MYRSWLMFGALALTAWSCGDDEVVDSADSLISESTIESTTATTEQSSDAEAWDVGRPSGRCDMVSVFDAMKGPTHDKDPVALGYILPDRIHLSEAGGEVGGAALAAAGFDPNAAP